MVEDSLKSCRALHRLILGVTAVTIVFAFSIPAPSPLLASRLAQLKRFKLFPFAEYEPYARNAALQATDAERTKRALPIEQAIEASGSMVFGTDKIVEAIARPIHYGLVLVGDTALVEGEAATLGALDTLFDVYVDDRPVQVVVPRTIALARSIATFLETEGQTAARVDNVRVEIDGLLDMVTTFIDSDDVLANVYFELLPAEGGAAPVFTQTVTCDVIPVHGTGVKSWLLAREEANGLIEQRDDQLFLFPSMWPRPDGDAALSVAALINKTGKMPGAASPVLQDIPLVGISVPGRLVVVAAPLVSALLLVYLLGHVSHLLSLSRTDGDEIRKFAWLPLNGRWGHIDAWISLTALPVVAWLVVTARLAAYETTSTGTFFVTGALTTVGVVTSVRVMRSLLRWRALGRPRA